MKHFKNIENISEFYGFKSRHPLINIQKYEDAKPENLIKNEAICFDFYVISFVKNFNGSIQIGTTKFFGESGVLHFIEPKQVYTCNSTNPWEGFQLLIHPEIFKKYFFHKEINSYDFFSYKANETLLLVEEEKKIVSNLMELAWTEFYKEKDNFSIPIILSYISTILNLAERFYARQFDSRKTLSNELSSGFYEMLKRYYSEQNSQIKQPSVSYFAEKLNITANYLSDSVRHHSGKSALTLIHDFVIEEAKKRLRNSKQSVSEISYQLGFEYPNYFSKLFKRKTNYSPSDYRKSVKRI